jgi:hypothetical protein
MRPAGPTCIAALLLVAGVLIPYEAFARQESARDLSVRAFELAYNLDHEEAMVLLRRGIEIAPDDPAAHRAMASVLWLHILFKRGAVTVDHYLGSFSRTQVELRKPAPDLDAAFRHHVERALHLAEARVKASPGDAQAHYDLGAAVGLRASYIATVEGKLLAGFRAARRAFDAHERVLALDPSRRDAGLIVGTYRYVVSTLSFPMRMMAYVAGFGGGRERGIRMLEEAAAHGGDSRTDAMFALILVYNRERRFDDAERVLGQLRSTYPRNRLVVLEEGATALRAGRFGQADRILSDGLARLAAERRERIPGEEALWRLKRGGARAGLGRADAADDLRFATGPEGQTWVRGRAHAELARLALTRGDRDGARTEAARARALCEEGSDPACVRQARQLLRTSDGR